MYLLMRLHECQVSVIPFGWGKGMARLSGRSSLPYSQCKWISIHWPIEAAESSCKLLLLKFSSIPNLTIQLNSADTCIHKAYIQYLTCCSLVQTFTITWKMLWSVRFHRHQGSDLKFSRVQEEEKEAELIGLNKLLNQEPFCCWEVQICISDF